MNSSLKNKKLSTNRKRPDEMPGLKVVGDHLFGKWTS